MSRTEEHAKQVAHFGFEYEQPDDLDEGVWYRAACSGLWYRNPHSAGTIHSVRVFGVTFEQIVTAKVTGVASSSFFLELPDGQTRNVWNGSTIAVSPAIRK